MLSKKVCGICDHHLNWTGMAPRCAIMISMCSCSINVYMCRGVHISYLWILSFLLLHLCLHPYGSRHPIEPFTAVSFAERRQTIIADSRPTALTCTLFEIAAWLLNSVASMRKSLRMPFNPTLRYWMQCASGALLPQPLALQPLSLVVEDVCTPDLTVH